jgi:hypothetical protein
VQAWSLWKDGNMLNLVDSSIVEGCSLDEALRCIHIGLLSAQNNPNARPLMSWVVSSLDNEAMDLGLKFRYQKSSEPNQNIRYFANSANTGNHFGLVQSRFHRI